MIDQFFCQAQSKYALVFSFNDVVSRYCAKILAFLPKLLIAVVILIAFVIIQKIVNKLVRIGMERLKWEIAVQQLILSVVKFTVLGFGVIIGLGQMGINVTSLIAGASVVGIGISFAAKDTLENLISGITILTDKTFKVGDVIKVSGSIGTVTKITLRSVRLKTKENYELVIPASKAISSEITNFTNREKANIYIPMGISYESDIDKARQILIDTLKEDERIAVDPAPAVVVTELADSSVNMRVSFTAAPSLEWPLKFEYNEKFKKALDKGGIDIPYPTTSVYMMKGDSA
ncbi:MAG: mechanosensitive ion channel [Candidatus Eremiobacteraeota bacterium]|nr:mechanosensitive ion channel [Candidatus Eremiobacteraeota bacterium]